MTTPERIQLNSDACWVVPTVSPPSLEGCAIDRGEATEGRLTLYDSWEWGLWHAGLLLVGDGAALWLFEERRSAAPVQRIAMAAPPRAASELPAGPLSNVVAPRLGLRALLPVATIPVQQREWLVRNEDDKIVVRLIEQTWPGDLRTLSVAGLRGYAEDADAIRSRLGASSGRPAILHGIEAAGVQPRHWTNKPLFELKGDEDARSVVAHMLETMVALARETEQGVVDDLDVEFLHDYRVLVRKARSLLSSTKGVFDPATTDWLKDNLRTIAKRTNALRDVDVHLLEHDEQVARLPEPLSPGLTAIHEDLKKRRVSVQRQVKNALQSATYGRRLRALRTRIQEAPAGPKAEKSIRKLADKRLASQLDKARKRGRAISEMTPDADVHALRIECKKLRYLLEFFRDLYDPEPTAKLGKALKGLQDVLGAFNDRSVQIEWLYGWLHGTSRGPSRVSVRTAAAVGALIFALSADKDQLRSQLQDAFQRFDESEWQDRFRAGLRYARKEAA